MVLHYCSQCLAVISVKRILAYVLAEQRETHCQGIAGAPGKLCLVKESLVAMVANRVTHEPRCRTYMFRACILDSDAKQVLMNAPLLRAFWDAAPWPELAQSCHATHTADLHLPIRGHQRLWAMLG